MQRKLIVAVAILLASAMFTFFGMWLAPYGVGLFRGDNNYNIILGFILSVFSIITIVLLCRKHFRIYSLPFIPHIIALGISMLYVNNDLHYIGWWGEVDYMGDGFVRVDPPFLSEQIRTTTGHVVFDHAYHISKISRGGTTLFVGGYSSINEVYDDTGDCILVQPSDDDYMKCNDNFFYSWKKTKRYEEEVYRVRLFDFSGNYISTRYYENDPYYSLDVGDFIKEKTEDVIENPNGLKIFKDISKTSIDSQSNNERLALSESSQRRVEKVKEPKECPRCHGVGKHKRIKCPKCGGKGTERNGSYSPFSELTKDFPPEVDCFYCKGQRYVNCPRDPNISYSNPFRQAPSSQSVNPYNNYNNNNIYNNDVAPVQTGNVKDPCGACNGTGKCTVCGGSGMTYNNMTEKWYRCDVCRQSGQCVGCRGRGYI